MAGATLLFCSSAENMPICPRNQNLGSASQLPSQGPSPSASNTTLAMS